VQQNHLDYKSRINLGSYYTNNNLVESVWGMIDDFVDKNTIVADTSCGYGNFLKDDPKIIGVDIDSKAIEVARKKYKKTKFFIGNSLKNINRKYYNLEKNKLCIIGNPPYNDTTSIIRSDIKNQKIEIDEDIKTRDLGISFLLSYQKLSADVICVLHPLSYLIKPANFRLLNNFNKEYTLKSGTIISSNNFKDSSKSMAFPIVIALYEKNKRGMDFNYIANFKFRVGNKYFTLNDFDTIKSYIKKYPNKNQQPKNDDILFWTMRDINALKRNRSFIQKYSYNAIIVDKSKLDYYIYVDVFKEYSNHIPYYFGNCDVLIDNKLFLQYRKYFILDCLSRNPDLRQYFADFDFNKQDIIDKNKAKIKEYLQLLLKEHYEN
jgi:hypothetical protein